MNKQFLADYYRMTGEKWNLLQGSARIIKYHGIRYLFYSRNIYRNKLFKFLSYRITKKYGLDFSTKNIGEGLYIGHPRNIVINKNALIGKCCNINHNVTIGQENRGVRKGSPQIGDYVWIGTGAIIVGNIVIGSNVLIAPGAFVNSNIPSNSLVIGNPCKVIARENPIEGYIEYKI